MQPGSNHCGKCQGLIAEPNRSYMYAGKFCHCVNPTPINTPEAGALFQVYPFVSNEVSPVFPKDPIVELTDKLQNRVTVLEQAFVKLFDLVKEATPYVRAGRTRRQLVFELEGIRDSIAKETK